MPKPRARGAGARGRPPTAGRALAVLALALAACQQAPDESGYAPLSIDLPDGIEALPDAIATTANDGRVAVLTDPTDRYGHAVLGDGIEAGSITILTEDGTVDEVLDVTPDVVESRLATWADVDGDGTDDLVATLSNAEVGARQVVWSSAWGRLDGEAIGRGNRWRHLIGIIPPDGDDPALLVEVVTPHLSRTVAISAITADGIGLLRARDLPIVSHTIGSRSLDDARLTDVDGDGLPELVGPGTDGSEVVIDLETLEVRPGS